MGTIIRRGSCFLKTLDKEIPLGQKRLWSLENNYVGHRVQSQNLLHRHWRGVVLEEYLQAQVLPGRVVGVASVITFLSFLASYTVGINDQIDPGVILEQLACG